MDIVDPMNAWNLLYMNYSYEMDSALVIQESTCVADNSITWWDTKW